MKDLQISSVESDDQGFIDFMNKWGEEIETIFPHYSEDDAHFGEIFILQIEGQDIGIFIFQYKGEELHVVVDYVIPSFRDIGVGQSLFVKKIEDFRKMGFKSVVSLTSNEAHRKYLIGCGFVNMPKHPDWFELTL